MKEEVLNKVREFVRDRSEFRFKKIGFILLLLKTKFEFTCKVEVDRNNEESLKYKVTNINYVVRKS
jgi:hypothetical protein